MPLTVHDNLTIRHRCPGRAIYVEPGGRLYISRAYTIYRSDDDGATWQAVTAMPLGGLRRWARVSRLASRALRIEVRALVTLGDGTLVAANREGICWAGPGQAVMTPSSVADGHVPAMPPITLSTGPEDRVLWGEYGGNKERRAVRLFVSDDGGRSFEPFHTFPAGDIRHVHNIVFDQGGQHYWVLVGDHGPEPGIGRLSVDLKDFEWVVKGAQRYRAVCLFDRGDHLLYGTDTEMEDNAIMRLDKSTGCVERVCPINGSCIYACRFGEVLAVTASVEPSEVNLSRDAVLWVSRDGDRWAPALTTPKDRWHETYFQFGSLVLPRGSSDREVIACSGQAVQEIDGQVLVAAPAGDLAS